MSCFEKWQVLNGAAANMLLFGTLLVAAIIGFKQMKIARQQTQINQKLLDLEYELSLDVEYDQQRKLLILWNRGRHNVYFGGVRFGGSGPLEPAPRQIPVGGKHEIHRHQDYDELAPPEGGYQEDVDLYLMDERHEKYMLQVHVSTHNRNGKLFSIDIRKAVPQKAEW